MDGAYQPTTEPRPTSTSDEQSCHFPAIWSRMRHRVPIEEDDDGGEEDHTRPRKRSQKNSYSQLCRPLPCVPSREDSNDHKRTASNPSLASKGSTLEREQPETPRASSSKWNIVRSKIKKGTEEFFCLCEDEQQKEILQQKWMTRGKRHCSKIYGQLVHDQFDGTGTPRFPSVSSGRSQQNVFGIVRPSGSPAITQPPRPILQRTKSRKESVAAMAWQGLKAKIVGGDFSAAVSNSQMIGKGRSFTPALIANLRQDEDVFVEPSSPQSFGEADDEVFFDFISGPPATTPQSLPAIKEMDEIDAPRSIASPEIDILPDLPPKLRDEEVVPPPLPAKQQIQQKIHVPQGHDEMEPLSDVPAEERLRGLHYQRQISTSSQRGNRIIRTPQPNIVRARQREIGKGLVGRWLNRTIKRRRLTSSVKKQMNDMEDYRPYFTYWISFVQTTILIITLAVYGFAPVGFTVTTKVGNVDRSIGGYLVSQREEAEITENFWIGPTRDALIQLGAKYAPCMRKDKELTRYLEMERAVEAKTGCCIGTDQNGCIQTSKDDCRKTFSTLHKYTTDNKSRAVCGQDPSACINPPSVAPNEWPSQDITKWPICKELAKRPAQHSPHLSCSITGRPCCIGDQAQCRIVSKDYCDFLQGVYHEEATLCSQVDCLGATCGLLPFLNPESPDQIYRLWLSLFLHAGIIHLLITLAFHFTILKDMEKMAGWLRIAIIYIFSGIGGNLLSAIITPYQPEVGPSGALFGIIACLLVELVQNWQIIRKPLESTFKLLILTVLLLLVGCFPWVDNFAHLGGLMFGTLLGFAFLPYLTFGKWDRRRKITQIVVSLGIIVALFVTLCLVFFVDQETTCSGCHYLNCIPFTEHFCSPALMGRGLNPRS